MKFSHYFNPYKYQAPVQKAPLPGQDADYDAEQEALITGSCGGRC